ARRRGRRPRARLGPRSDTAPTAASRPEPARLGLGDRRRDLGDALLAQARGLAGEVAQVIELRASNATAADDLDALDAGRVQRERPLDAHALRDAADGEGRPRPFAALADDDALERLQPFLLALDDLHVHAHGVAGDEAVAVLLELSCFHEPNGIHDVVPFRGYSGVSPRLNRSTSSRSSAPSAARSSSSGRVRPVRYSACGRRQLAMRAGSPESRPAGALAPRTSSGGVYCGGSSRPSANDSRSAAPSPPSPPGSRRTTASVTTSAGSSPPVST